MFVVIAYISPSRFNWFTLKLASNRVNSSRSMEHDSTVLDSKKIIKNIEGGSLERFCKEWYNLQGKPRNITWRPLMTMLTLPGRVYLLQTKDRVYLCQTHLRGLYLLNMLVCYFTVRHSRLVLHCTVQYAILG